MTESEKQGPLVPISLPPSTPCRIIKWVAEPGARVRKGTVLLTYSTDVSSAELSETETETVLKSTLVGVVKERLFEEGEIVHPGYVYELIYNIIVKAFFFVCTCISYMCSCWYRRTGSSLHVRSSRVRPNCESNNCYGRPRTIM